MAPAGEASSAHVNPLRFLPACLAAGVLLAAAAPAAANPWLTRTDLNIAHQGGELEAPSATMYALKTAVEKGAEVLELDVHLTSDGHVVAIHDAAVDRTTDGSGSIEEMTLAEAQQLDAAFWFVPERGAVRDEDPSAYPLRGIATGDVAPPEGFGPGDFVIPALDEVLRTFPDVFVNIELKPTQRQSGALELAVAGLLDRYDRTDDVIVVSFLDHSTELFKALAPAVTTATGTAQAAAFWAGSQNALPGLPNPRYAALQVPPSFGVEVVNRDFIANAHANGLAVHVWTINDETAMRRLLDQGADGIMTDRPTLLERVLEDYR